MESKLASRSHLSSISYINVILCQLMYVRNIVPRHDNDNLPYVFSQLLFSFKSIQHNMVVVSITSRYVTGNVNHVELAET